MQRRTHPHQIRQHGRPCIQRTRDARGQNHHNIDRRNKHPRARAVTALEKLRRRAQFQRQINVHEKHREERKARRPDELKRSRRQPDRVGESRLTNKLLAGNIRRKHRRPDHRPRRLTIREKERLRAPDFFPPKPKPERDRQQKIGSHDNTVEGRDAKCVHAPMD